MKYILGDLLKEICEKSTVNNQYPVLTSSKSGIYLQEDYFTKNVASKDNTGYKIIRRGQFTYRSMSDTGAFYINCMDVVDAGLVSPAYPVFEIKDEKVLNRNFLIHFFKSTVFNKKISLLSKGSTRLSLKYKDLKNVEIDLPSLEEQLKIASVLDKLYELLEVSNTELSDLDSLAYLKFVEMFGDPVDNPLNFEMKKLGDIAYITKLAGFEFTKYIKYKDFGEIIMIRGLNCKKGKLVLDDVYYESKETSDALPRSKLYKGDIVLTYVGTIAECALIDEDNKYHLAPNVAKVTLNDKEINLPEFFTSMFVFFKDYIESFSSATSQSKLSMAEIRDIPFLVPPTQLQKVYKTFIAKIDESKEQIKNRITHLNELLEIKMEEYFE